jgi:3-isopropylmalate dehydrogenase
MTAKVAILPGDGIGPQVTRQAVRVLEAAAELHGRLLETVDGLIGGASIEASGVPLTDETLELCRGSDAVLLGAVGGPAWDGLEPQRRPEAGLLRLRKELELFANIRPVRPHMATADASTLKPSLLGRVDLVIVRELTGGLYFGEPRGRSGTGRGARALDTLVYSDHEIRRVLELACKLARGRRRQVTSVDKANVLESSRLWREIAGEVAREHSDLRFDHQLVDSCAYKLLREPTQFDVIVTENLFGDILSDEAGVLVGSLGLLPSASLGSKGPGLFEPVHGSAPDIAGHGIANPIGAILSTALMATYSLGWADEALAIEQAVEAALDAGARTRDLGGSLSTGAMTNAVLAQLHARGALAAVPGGWLEGFRRGEK